MTFAQSLTRSLIKGMVWMLLIPTAVLAANVMSTSESVERPLPATSPVSMMENCQTADNGETIRYAIVQPLNSGAVKVFSQKKIDRAVNDAVFGKDWKNVRIIGFCK